MTQEQAFLADIVGNPDDSGPRLVYADWLDEQGRPEQATFWRSEQAAALARVPKALTEAAVAFGTLLRSIAANVAPAFAGLAAAVSMFAAAVNPTMADAEATGPSEKPRGQAKRRKKT
jgi:uncharacterized protein (TIGR02996 family)